MSRSAILPTTMALSAAVLLSGAVAGQDTTDGYCLHYSGPSGTPPETLEVAAATLDRRLTAMEIDGAVAVDTEAGTIDVRLSGGSSDPVAIADLATALGAVGESRFVPVPPGCVVDFTTDQTTPACVMEATPLFDRSGVTSAEVGEDGLTGEPIVRLQLDEEAARLFDAHAAQHLGEYFALVMDDEVVMSPAINAKRYDGRLLVTGAFTPMEARALAAILPADPLPAELTFEVAGECETP